VSGIQTRFVLLEIAHPAFLQTLHLVATAAPSRSTRRLSPSSCSGAFPPAFNSWDDQTQMMPA
jgi:hypothetical protein